MLSREEIEKQQNLLQVSRQTLALLLKQQAMFGVHQLPPFIVRGIAEARTNIQNIKQLLRENSVEVNDDPDDISQLDTEKKQPLIFISYQRGNELDSQIANTISKALEQKHQVFLDQTLSVGENWAKSVEFELKNSDAVIVLLSPQSASDEMLAEEIITASKTAELENGRPFIIPVRLNYHEQFQYPLSVYLSGKRSLFWGGPQDTIQLTDNLMNIISKGNIEEVNDASWVNPKQLAQRSSLHEPLPVAQPNISSRFLPLEAPEGTMSPESRFYISRRADDFLWDYLERTRGSTITIKGPRQIGKSSLLIRAINKLVSTGKKISFLDFQLIDRSALNNAQVFYRQFCSWISNELDIRDRVDEYWRTSLGNSQLCTNYIEEYVLPEINQGFVLAIDEVDNILNSEFRSEFFGMLRSWHNKRAIRGSFDRLDLLLVTSTEPYQFIQDLSQSPFNVGQKVELSDFTFDQVSELNRRHQEPLSQTEVRRLMDLLNGHPYLVRRALYLVAIKQETVAHLFATATDDTGPFGDHLRNHLFRLYNSTELVDGMARVLLSDQQLDKDVLWRLQGAGLVRREGEGRGNIVPRCKLYKDYFGEHILTNHPSKTGYKSRYQ